MASIRINGVPEPPAPTAPAHEPWPSDGPVSIRADELFARRLDTEFSAGVRTLLHDPETGLSSLSGEAALEAVAGIYPALEALKQRTLGDAVGPRQKALLQPLIDTRLEWAASTIGRLAERATVEVDDLSVAERLAGLRQDAEASWHDPAHLQKLGRAAVGELRWQGERRGWGDTETDARTRGGLSDLYAGAVEAAMVQDLDGAASLLAHAREVIAPDRLQAIDRHLTRAREDGLLREVDAALSALPLDPASPPLLDGFITRMSELAPENAAPEVRARLDELAVHAQRRAERQWQKLQSEAGIAALDWFRQNPDAALTLLPRDMRAWLAPDQVDGLKTLEEHGRLVTDPDLFERLDRQLVYEPDTFAALDLDRHRLSLDDGDHARFASVQKALVEGEIDPALARWRLARLDIDHALEQRDIDGDGAEAAGARADMRHLLDAFEAIESRPATVADIDAIVVRALGEAADGALVREPSEPFDPQHVVPTQAGRPPTRPPPPGTQPTPLPGPRDNRPRPETPPGLPTLLENFGRGRQSVPPAPAAPLPPNAAGPGAAAAGDDEARRRRALEEARESLKALAPDHQFLKEPPDAVPDQAKVDRHEREVVRIVSEKVDAKVGELRSKSTYEQRSEIRTIGGDVDLRAEFDKLKVTGRRIFSGDGQYGRGGSGEMYELPGGTRVGFRMANDVRTGAKNSVPTLDVAVPGSNQVRFHYNPTR